MTNDQAKGIPPGTRLFLVREHFSLEDPAPDVAPSRCHVMEPDPNWTKPEAGELWINLGGWYVLQPVERLHLRWRSAIRQTLRILEEQKTRLEAATDEAWRLWESGPPPIEEE